MSSQQPGPALRKRQLATELGALREAAGLDTDEVAQHLHRHRSLISHWESKSGRRVPAYTDLVVLLQLYDAQDRLAELDELREAANQRGWWEIPSLPQATQVYLGLESDATSVRCFAQELIPGLLQHPDYARDLERRHGTTDLDEVVNTRMRRQARVGTELSIEVVVCEGVLWRTLHMAAVGAGQLRRLREAATAPGVTMSVLEYSAGAHRSMSGSFTLLDFPEHIAPPVAHCPYAQGAQLVDDPGVVDDLEEIYGELTDVSVGVEQSTAMAAVMRKVKGTR